MENENLFALTYSTLVAMFNSVLVILGEAKIDIYLATNISSYYLAYLIFLREREATLARKLVNLTFLSILLIVIIIRTYEVIR